MQDVVLKEKPFYALSPLDQLTVIINLINVVVGMRSFDAYMKSVRAEIQKIVEELKTLEEKVVIHFRDVSGSPLHCL